MIRRSSQGPLGLVGKPEGICWRCSLNRERRSYFTNDARHDGGKNEKRNESRSSTATPPPEKKRDDVRFVRKVGTLPITKVENSGHSKSKTSTNSDIRKEAIAMDGARDGGPRIIKIPWQGTVVRMHWLNPRVRRHTARSPGQHTLPIRKIPVKDDAPLKLGSDWTWDKNAVASVGVHSAEDNSGLARESDPKEPERYEDQPRRSVDRATPKAPYNPSGPMRFMSTISHGKKGFPPVPGLATGKCTFRSFSSAFHARAIERTAPDIREQLRLWQVERDREEAEFQKTMDETRLQRTLNPMQKLILQAQENEKIVSLPVETDEDPGEFISPVDYETYAPESSGGQLFLQRGDVVELMANERAILAVYVRRLGKQSQFYTIQGKWVHRFATSALFCIPRFFDPQEVAPIIPYLPKTEVSEAQLDAQHEFGISVPREPGAAMIKKMIEFQRAADEVYREKAHTLDKAWEKLATKKTFSYTTLPKIAKKLLQTPSEDIPLPSLWAVHRALVARDIGLRPSAQDHAFDGEWEILCERDVELIEQIRRWLREHQEAVVEQLSAPSRHGIEEVGAPRTVISEFSKKAQEIIKESRRYRKIHENGALGPSSVQCEPHATHWQTNKKASKNVVLGTFEEQEVVILRFMEFWSARRSIRPDSSAAALGPMLLRATGMYKEYELGRPCGYLFLQEMGVLAPWQNRIAFNSRLALPGHHLDLITDELQDKAIDSIRKWEPVDSMKRLRKDWGDLQVFCVDRAESMEIDDGFSLESIEGDESHHWLHVHIANPTAFMSPEHPMAVYAAQITETLYLPEKNYYMLSPKVADKYFSLDKNRPALTFSAKVNSEGDILETQITPSIIRNVTFVTPQAIRENLAPDDAMWRPVTTYTVGQNPPPDAPNSRLSKLRKVLTETQLRTLKKIQLLAAARRKQRIRSGGIAIDFGSSEANVNYVDTSLPYRQSIRRVEGDPTIRVVAPEFQLHPDRRIRESEESDLIVPDMMILTGEVAAIWCSQRNIPVVYRGTTPNPEFPIEPEYKTRFLDPEVEKYGKPTFATMLGYIALAGKGTSHPDPTRHTLIGTDGYTKITSPLRRYGDMIGHWQIEAAIRHEARTGVSLVETKDNSCLPFSRADIMRMLPRIAQRERLITNAKRASSRHWWIQFFSRAHNFNEIELPKTFEVYIQDVQWSGTDRKVYGGIMKSFHFEVTLLDNEATKAEGGLQPGDFWEAEIMSVNTYDRFLDMCATRLISREGRMSGTEQPVVELRKSCTTTPGGRSQDEGRQQPTNSIGI